MKGPRTEEMRSPESTEPNGSGALAPALFQGSMQKLCARRPCCARCPGRLPECYGVRRAVHALQGRAPQSPRNQSPRNQHSATSPCCVRRSQESSVPGALAVPWPGRLSRAHALPQPNKLHVRPRCQAPSLRQEDAWGLQARGALQARREGRLRFVRKEESWKTTVPIRLAGGCVLAMVCRRLKHLSLSCESTQNGIKGRCADPATSQRDTCEPLPSSAQRAESHRIRVSPRGSLARPPPELQQR
jgi:hypothetical protein